ncbi:MAG: hypothetical protein M3Q39_01755 [Actinomycetota bacterium]|nr:hypothetical protein [Actinomycetota bacterium]
MELSNFDEACAWVAKHQVFNVNTHYYSCIDPFDPSQQHTGKTTAEVVLRITASFNTEMPNLWRRRLGVNDF